MLLKNIAQETNDEEKVARDISVIFTALKCSWSDVTKYNTRDFKIIFMFIIICLDCVVFRNYLGLCSLVNSILQSIAYYFFFLLDISKRSK